jgi:Ca2+-binding RTX toxin-like protein
VLTSVSYTLGAGVEVESLRTTNDNGTAAINLTGNGFENAIRGNDGNNILNGGAGSDALDGDGGVDTTNYLGNTGRVIVVLGSNGSTGVAYEFATVNNQEILVSVDTLASIENVQGSIFSDTLVGNEAVNTLRGFNGNDIYVVQNAGDVVIELGGQGADEVRTSVSYALSANADIEIFRTTDDAGTAAITLTGNGIGNSIIGNAGNNAIDGAGGADHLFGGRGADILTGGAQGDTFVWSSLDQTGVTVPNMDVIQDFDFAAGDRIDLSQVDANVFADGNQSFRFVGQAAFSGTPGEINYVHLNGNTVIQMQTGTSADIEGGIVIAGVHTPDASWFVL